jgi:hypothetical protein
MIEVLQKVTTFPLELIDIPKIDKLYSDNDIHRYYSDLITKKDKNPEVGSVSEDELTNIGTYTTKYNAQVEEAKKKNIKPPLSSIKKEDIDAIKRRFVTYNAIYDKLFANNLNVLEKTDEPTVIVFPIYDQTDKGRVEINPKATRYYYNKFEKIKKTIEFKNKENENENICYIGLNVFTSEKKEEYKKYIKTQLDDIKKLIDDYNENVKQLQSKSPTPPKFIKNLLFIIDTDKKGLFTGFYKTQLTKEKQEILNKEYSSFLSSAGIRYRKVDDASITLTFSNVVSETKRFKQRTTIGIGPNFLSNKEFDEFITKLKELYKKVTDKQYKDSLELKDNIKDFKIFYKLENADKVLEDKIQTGSNKLYYIHKEDKNNVIGSFLLVSEERGIYRFKEDASQYRIRITNESKTISSSITNSKPNDNKEMEVDNEPNTEKESEDPTPDGAYDFAVQIKNNYGIFKYKNLDKKETKKEVLEGEIFPYLDKTKGSFKWFNHRDIDASLLNKEIIKYYSDILFDKKTLIEYLKSKNKYTDKTILAYEFLKINDSQELSDYCDFIHNKFKSNIIDLSPSGFDAFNPFKIKFDDNTIIKNIRDILFDTNTPIYLIPSKQTKDTQREVSRDSYKIVTYKIFEDFEKDESCQPKENSKDNKNKCKTAWVEYTKKGLGLPIIVVVTKANQKDVGLLKSKTDCKSKKNKLIYDYKKLFSNITRRIGTSYLGGTKKSRKISGKKSGKISGKRRLKAKRYK